MNENIDWLITGVNLALTLINLWIILRLKRPYSKRQLERYDRQWRSNLNFAQVKAIIDEANKTESRQRQTPESTSDLFTRPEGFSNGKSGLSDLPPGPVH